MVEIFGHHLVASCLWYALMAGIATFLVEIAIAILVYVIVMGRRDHMAGRKPDDIYIGDNGRDARRNRKS